MSGDLDIRIPLQELRDLLEGIAPYTDIRCALAQIAELERLADLLAGEDKLDAPEKD